MNGKPNSVQKIHFQNNFYCPFICRLIWNYLYMHWHLTVTSVTYWRIFSLSGGRQKYPTVPPTSHHPRPA
jgi:hypothetical protein